MLLKKTGIIGGVPKGKKKENEKFRSIRRQYEAANAIAYAGYRIVLHPDVTKEDRHAGYKGTDDPDYRIEGELFDCYTPDPAGHVRLNTWKSIYDEMAIRQSEYVEKACVEEGLFDKRFGYMIDRKTREEVLNKTRENIKDKIRQQKVNNLVLNLTDVVLSVTEAQVMERLMSGGIKKLKRVLIVVPCKPPVIPREYHEVIDQEVSSYMRRMKIWYYYSKYSPDRLKVTQYEVNTCSVVPDM